MTIHRVSALALALCPILSACAAGKPPAVEYAPSSASSAPATYTPAAPTVGSEAPAPATVVISGAPTPPTERPGLATRWGEATWSPITHTPFVRAASAPFAAAVIHYNDVEGVTAHAAYLGAAIGPLEAWAGDGDVSVALIDDSGAVLPGVVAGGRSLVAAVDGARYRVVVRNHTSARFEVVTSVDGLDVIDGKPAGFDRRGSVVAPHDELTIDGFRQSASEVAAFRFGRVSDSYAAATGDAANVGVIGVALFAERGAVWSRDELERRDRASPFPGEPGRNFAVAP